IDQGVTAALAARDALRSTNGDDSHNSRTCVRRTERATHKCTYTDFLKCQPLPFKGTEGVASLSQWCERIESVFHISNCAAKNQVKFATCTLHSVALTWWNTYVQTIGHEAAYGMTWKTLMKMMTEKYYPRNEIRKLEMKLWDLKVKGTDLVSYTQRYQELALLCGRMFSKEYDKIEKYVEGLPDMIHRSVVASMPKTMQEAIKIATELMDNITPHKMVNVNAPSGQAPEMAPPVRTDDQIFPRIRWVPNGKSNCYLDLEKSQGNPIYKIAVDLLKNTNFFRAFTASSTIPSIYIQQFWDTIQYDKKAVCYICQLDEQWRHKFHPRSNSPLRLPNEEPVLGYLKFSAKGTKREVFGMPIPGSLITADIQEASYYREYLAKVAPHRRYMAGERRGVQDPPAPKPTQPARKPKSTTTKAPPRPAATSVQPAPTLAPAKPQEKKCKQATETSDKPPKAKKSKYGWVSKKRTLKTIEASKAKEVPGMEPKVAAKYTDLQKALEKSIKTAYALPRGPLPPVVIREPKSRKYQPLPEVPGKGKAKVTKEQVAHDLLSLHKPKKKSHADQYMFQRRISKPAESSLHDESPYAGLDPGAQAEGQTGSDAENLKLAVEEQVLLEEPASSSGTLSSLQHLSRDISFGDQFFSNKPSDADKNAETEVESMVNVPIQQAMSLISLMTSLIIDLTSRPESPKRIGELEHIMDNLIQVNKHMEERLVKHGARLYTLEQLDISQQVSIAVSEVITDAIDWAMQASLRNRFRDLLKADMKEILHQHMWDTESYKTHEDHTQLFKALENSMNRDHSKELAQDLAEARKKKKKSHESSKTPPGSPLHYPPPPPPPPAGPSGASGAPGASGSSQQPPPLPPPSLTNQEKERPATPEPAWSISSSDASVPSNNWASALASNYSPPREDSLLAQTGDMATFIDWFCKRREYLRYGSKGSRPALSISKMKAAYYLDAGLEQMVPDQFWIDEECKYNIAAMYGISHWWFQRQ
nr:reverse transcriptase domain-containing protein [Tanacetum cinerariifolium]